MLDRQHDEYYFECDVCSAVLETGTGNFQQAIAKMRDEGWRAQEEISGWKHYCRKCQGGKR